MSGDTRLPSQRRPQGYRRPAPFEAEPTSQRRDEASNLTWLRSRFTKIEAICTENQIRAVRYLILCGGNGPEAAFRGGFKDRYAVNHAVRAVVAKLLKAETAIPRAEGQ
jgi:hypothetical protein